MLQFLLNTEAIILIFGGTLGSVMISYPWSVLRKGTHGRALDMFPQTPLPGSIIKDILRLAEKARRDRIDSWRKGAVRLASLSWRLRPDARGWA